MFAVLSLLLPRSGFEILQYWQRRMRFDHWLANGTQANNPKTGWHGSNDPKCVCNLFLFSLPTSQHKILWSLSQTIQKGRRSIELYSYRSLLQPHQFQIGSESIVTVTIYECLEYINILQVNCASSEKKTYFSRNSGTTNSSHLYRSHFFPLATPCPKCPTQHWVSYSKRYVHVTHCSRNFHDSCCQCLASRTWAHADHAKFKL